MKRAELINLKNISYNTDFLNSFVQLFLKYNFLAEKLNQTVN